MTKKEKKKEFKFFWEEPIEKARTKTSEKLKFEPFEFKFTIPKFPAIPEMKLSKTIPVNISTNSKEIIVNAELPGFKKNEINLNVTESFIEISASRQEKKIERSEKLFKQELSSGALKRAFSLPDKVDPDKATAKLEEGLLTVILPKTHPQKKKKKRLEIK